MQKIMFNDKFGLTKAVLHGRKTQTRRIALHSKEDVAVLEKLDLQPEDRNIVQYVINKYSRYAVGETLAIAESYQMLWETEQEALLCTEASQVKAYYAKHYPGYTIEQINRCAGWKNKMFIRAEFMPHQIRITNIRLECLQDISEEDCLKEGIESWDAAEEYYRDKGVKKSIKELKASGITPYQIPEYWACFTSPKAAYAYLIDKISGKGTWDKNPWVFVYDFELVK